MEKPKDILRKMIPWCGCFGRGIFGKPGDLIKALRPNEREILKDLKPEDIQNDRWPLQ